MLITCNKAEGCSPAAAFTSGFVCWRSLRRTPGVKFAIDALNFMIGKREEAKDQLRMSELKPFLGDGLRRRL